jgi:uncharacterized membrane protein HdeD (DUF308 family)
LAYVINRNLGVPMSETRRHTATWLLLVITGIAWIVLSVVILRFEYTTVEAVAVLFGVYCLVAAATQITIAAVSSSTGSRMVHGLLAALLILAGVVSFANFGATFDTLAAIISFYFVLRGCFDIVVAFAANMLSGWWLLLMCGFVELGLGFWAAGSWTASVAVLVAWVAAAALVHGIADIAMGFQMHVGGHAVTGIDGRPDQAGVTHHESEPGSVASL